MKVYYYDELREMTIDDLLDLLSTYTYLKNDIYKLIKETKDKDDRDYYAQNNLFFYVLNSNKIKQELTIRTD